MTKLAPILDYADVVADLRYSSENNVLRKKIASQKEPMLNVEAAKALAEVVEKLTNQQLKLVIWDAYRTLETQNMLKAVIPDERYVLRHSNHEKGAAVDATLANTAGKYLDMGTDFDEFSPKAHSNSTDITDKQTENRAVLRSVMESSGFKQWPYEWWHFDYSPTNKSDRGKNDA